MSAPIKLICQIDVSEDSILIKSCHRILNEGGKWAPWELLTLRSMGAEKAGEGRGWGVGVGGVGVGGLKSMSGRKKGLKLTFF